MTLPIELITILLLIAVTVNIAIKRIKVPYSIALVVVGLIIGVFHIVPPLQMTPELILVLFLPALLFETSFNINLSELKKDWLPIFVLSTIGVVLSMFLIAGILHIAGGMIWQEALLFGAMVSATDPISVLSIFKQTRADHRLEMLLKGESLFNDGAAVVLFQLALAFFLLSSPMSYPQIGGIFCFTVVGGIVLGIIIGFAVIKYSALFDDHLLELMMTTVVAYGSYLLADQLHASAVLSVVVAGIILGNYSKFFAKRSRRIAVDWFWEYAAFAANSLVFLLIGMQINLPLLSKYSWEIILAIVALLVSRLVIVYGLCPILSTKSRPIPLPWQHILFWGALRGSLSMALALSLPKGLLAREEIIVMTFGTVLFTLLVQGLTVEPLIRFLTRKDQQAVTI